MEPKGCELLRGLLHLFGCDGPQPDVLVVLVQIGPEEPDPLSGIKTTERSSPMAEIIQSPISMSIEKGRRRQVIFTPLKSSGEPAVLDGDPSTPDNLDDAVSVLVKDPDNGNMYFRGIGVGTTSGTLLFDVRLGPAVRNIEVPYTVAVTDLTLDEAASVTLSVGDEEDDPLAVVA